MHLSLATRAIAALVAGLALRDCVLLAASVLLWAGHLQQTLAAVQPDRTKLWLRCIAQGAVLVALGLALAIHTAAVFLVMWPDHNGQPWLSASIVLLLAFAGAPAQPTRRASHGRRSGVACRAGAGCRRPAVDTVCVRDRHRVAGHRQRRIPARPDGTRSRDARKVALSAARCRVAGAGAASE